MPTGLRSPARKMHVLMLAVHETHLSPIAHRAQGRCPPKMVQDFLIAPSACSGLPRRPAQQAWCNMLGNGLLTIR